jgi:hypothetical protein
MKSVYRIFFILQPFVATPTFERCLLSLTCSKLISIQFCLAKLLKFLWDGHLARPSNAT